METIKILLGIVIIAIGIFSPGIIYAIWVMDKIKNIEEEDRKEEIRIMDKENKILKENAENNDKVVDRVNWENQLLKKENKQLKDNWNKLKQIIDVKMYNSEYLINLCGYKVDVDTLEILKIIKKEMQELEQGSDE